WHYPHYWVRREVREQEQGIGPFTAIRVGNWKYIYTYDDGRSFLYDLSSDIGEKKNLLNEHKEKAGELLEELLGRMKSLDANRPIDRRSEERRVGKECRSRWSSYR